MKNAKLHILIFAAFLVQLQICGQEPHHPLNLGKDWFNQLRDPATRIEALRHWDRARRARDKVEIPKEEDTLEYFSAHHRGIQVIKAPQPGFPDSWLVWWAYDYRAQREVLEGPDPDRYPPASVRPPGFKAEERDRPGIAWLPGEPWLESVGAFLTNEQGKTLCNYNFLGCGVIADANGDGMLDWVEFSRLSFRKMEPDSEKHLLSEQADLVSIGPIDPDAPRTAAWLLNFCPDLPDIIRIHRLDIRSRKAGAGLDVVAVPANPTAVDAPPEILLQVIHEKPAPTFDEVVALGPGEPREKAADFATKIFGWKQTSVGLGSVDASKLRAGEPQPVTFDTPRRDFSVPKEIAKLSPGQAALALVDHNRDDSHRKRFDLVLEPPLPENPETGWVEITAEPGWGASRFTVWWLREDGAECWECEPKNGAKAFFVSTEAREPLSHWISILAHLDRVRSVARYEAYDDLDHDSFGGDDHTIYTIQAGVVKPLPRITSFDPSAPSLWNAIRGPVDRPLTSVLAATLGNAPPGWDASSKFAHRDLTEVAERLLRPEIIATVPPPLARQVIYLIGNHGIVAQRPRLQALLDHWGPADADERAFSEARNEERTTQRMYWEPSDKREVKSLRRNLAIANFRVLEQKQVNHTPAQLRESVLQTLRMFDSQDDPVRLEVWSKEIDDPGAPWASDRLDKLREIE